MVSSWKSCFCFLSRCVLTQKQGHAAMEGAASGHASLQRKHSCSPVKSFYFLLPRLFIWCYEPEMLPPVAGKLGSSPLHNAHADGTYTRSGNKHADGESLSGLPDHLHRSEQIQSCPRPTAGPSPGTVTQHAARTCKQSASLPAGGKTSVRS